MKILVLKSSGNKHGSSNMLADGFIRGASKNGHSITEYDVAHKDIRPLNDNTASAETLMQMMFCSMSENMKLIYFN